MNKRWLLLLAGSAFSVPAHAQLSGPVRNGENTITVTAAKKPGEARIEMSNWRMAETPHVVVFSQDDEGDLKRTAHNLEKLHFLLSALMGRLDAPDETIKIAVTMIGVVGTFEQLHLTDLRWQYGPYARPFAKTVYYDPRADGPVLATTKDGVNAILQPSDGKPSNRNCDGEKGGESFDNTIVFSSTGTEVSDATAADAATQIIKHEIAVCQSAESRLYSGFAQNFLMTYYPAAYPRWFLQGFGELFATMEAKGDQIEYGLMPGGFFEVMKFYSDYPVKNVLDERYRSGKGRSWTPFHAWRIAHLLYFSEEWKPRLHAYLAAMARGEDPQDAARLLGDPAELQRAVARYGNKKLQAVRLTYPADRTPEPIIRQLTRAEAGLIRGRLELGARIEVPAESGPERETAIDRRAAWLARLRSNAAKFPELIENQLLLAEAECRSGNGAECLAAADRALAQTPSDKTAMVWRGTALAQLAARASAAERPQRLAEARSQIAQANRLDPDGILPLIAYYESFSVAGAEAPDMAVDGLAKVAESSPSAPAPRLKLGREMVRRELDDAARDVLLPVAKGAFDTPEQREAAKLLPKARAAKAAD